MNCEEGGASVESENTTAVVKSSCMHATWGQPDMICEATAVSEVLRLTDDHATMVVVSPHEAHKNRPVVNTDISQADAICFVIRRNTFHVGFSMH